MGDVVDLAKRREKAAVESGDAGYFMDAPPDVGDMLAMLGEPGGPQGIGLLNALTDEEHMDGWALMPDQARKLARELLDMADAIEQV